MSVYLLLVLLASMAGKMLDDKELSAEIRKGNKEAFQEFFDRYYDALFRFLRAKGTDTATAKDLIQNAFLYIWENRNKIDETKSLRSYLYRVAYTRMLNHVKYQKRFKDPQPDEDEYNGNPEDVFTDDDQLSQPEMMEGKELLDIVKRAIHNMPEKRAMVFEFCFMQEFTYKETAGMMDISVNTVENHMTKAFKDVRKAVKEYYPEGISED